MNAIVPRDTIPRLHRIVAHTRDQLRGLANGAATFEDCRVRYGHTQRRLAQEGRGRSTAPSAGVGERVRNWAPTRDCLSELMRLDAVENKPLPSSKRLVGSYRDETYKLTDHGMYLAELTPDSARFIDELGQGLIAAHPYLRLLLQALEQNPVRCPTVGEGDLERCRRGTRGWAEWAAERIGDGTLPGRVEKAIREHLDRRFGKTPTERPGNKALAETMNDALMVAAFTACDVHLDATTIKTLLRWGSDLLLYDQSRYVPAHPDANVIWLAADLTRQSGGDLLPTRRGIAEYGGRVAHAFRRAYWEQARQSGSSLAEPYLPIHRLRAQVAYECTVTRALGDMVLSRLADGDYPEVAVEVLLHVGMTGLPASEPAFRHHGRRRLEATMRNKPRSAA